MFLSTRIKQEICRFNCIDSQFFHLRQDTIVKQTLLVVSTKIFVKIDLKFLVTHLISFFIFTVIIRMLLHCVIGEVCEQIAVSSKGVCCR